ncbi:MAG TPA: VanW family protein [Acidimicrobiia bacterium]
MNRNHFLFRVHPLLAAVTVVGAVMAALLALYGLTRWVSQGEVIGRVVVGDVSIGGLKEAEAERELADLEERLLTRRATFSIEGRPVTLDPPAAGLTLDVEGMTRRAMSVGREGNAVYQFLYWLTHIFSTVELPIEGSLDPVAVEELFDQWDAMVIAEPVSLGGIEIVDGTPTPVYPKTGIGLNRPQAAAILEAALLDVEPGNHDLPTTVIVPGLTEEDIDEAVAEATQLVTQPINLTYEGESVTFSPEELAAAYRAEITEGDDPEIVHTFDPEIIDSYLDPIRSEFEAEPVDARFEIDGDSISIVPGRNGTRIDEVETARELLEAGFSGSRSGDLPVVEGAEPDVTTAELEAMNITHLVSQFTTHHACCQDRVVNIQLMADTVDGAIVMPGEIFSLNGFVGERTLEKGYLPAGTIVAGELEDTVGGGVSQFATTMYNAVFWGGYQDIEHRPHSYYFSRYPEGIEATINWTSPDLRFRNNSDSAILIDTRHTDTSITVRIFGNNDGRTVKGQQINGQTRIEVVSEGGPNARVVEASVSDRFNIKEPPAPEYRTNPSLRPDQVITIQSPDQGWTVEVVRRILVGGSEVSRETWTVVYRPQRAIYEVHPCRVPGKENTCPTTTTVPPPTTTTPAPPTSEGGGG